MRVQGLNRLLLEKMKEVEETRGESDRMSEEVERLRKVKKELKRVKQVNSSLEDVLTQREATIVSLSQQYDSLKSLSLDFVSKTSALYTLTQRLTEAIQLSSAQPPQTD